GTIRTSPDGINWTARSSGTTTDLYAVTWTGSLLVTGGDEQAGGENGAVFRTSPDGVNWTARNTSILQTQGQGRSTQRSGSRLLAGGTSGGFWSSTDGITWVGGEYIFSGAIWMSVAIAGNTRVMVSGHSHPSSIGDVAASAVDAEEWPASPYSSGTKSAG